VVTISVPLGRPSSRRGGGGGAAGRWAAVALLCAAAAGDFAAAFAFLGFVAADDLAAVADDFAAVADDFVAAMRFAAAPRDEPALARPRPPRRVGRLDGRLPRTLASAAALEDFFDFFLADFCVMDTVNGDAGAARFDFKKYSA
jgi:hypothetical protein